MRSPGRRTWMPRRASLVEIALLLVWGDAANRLGKGRSRPFGLPGNMPDPGIWDPNCFWGPTVDRFSVLAATAEKLSI